MEEMTDKEKAFIWQQGNVYSKGLASREIQNAHEKGIDYMSTHELNDVGKRILELISKYGREATFKGAICHANEKMWRYVYRGEIIGKKPLEEKMNMKKQTIKLNESQLRKIVKESVRKILRENDDEPFLKTGLSQDSKYFKRYDTNQGPLVLYNGKVYKWSFVDFMKHRDEMIEKHGSLSNKAVGDWMSNGGLQQSNVNVDNLQGMQDEWQRGRDEEARKASVIKSHRADFENACDYLYYGYGYDSWLKNSRNGGSNMSDEDSKIIWQAAFNKMANED